MSNRSWNSRFSGVPDTKHVAGVPHVDAVFKETPLNSFSGEVVSGDGMEFSYNTSANDRVRAAKVLDQHNSIYLDDEGISKTANIGGGSAGGGIASATAVDFYSPWLSTDYLELPRSYSEERRWYRFFYDQDPIVGRAIDLKTFIPLSKMTLSLPKAQSKTLAKKVHTFYEKMWKDLKMYEKISWIVKEYHLIGECIPYFEWDDTLKKWTKVLLLDPDLCDVRYMPYTDETRVFLRPDMSIKEVVEDLRDKERYSEFAQTLDEFSDEAISESENSFIELNTDPRKGSFALYLGNRRSPYRPGPGVSVLRRLLRPLLFRDKLRQALTQIASRHMTPVRIVWADGLGPEDVNALRDQVDFALMGPDFSIVTNYELNWQEITAEARLFDATAVLDRNTEELLIGLGMTKELLLGEGSYGAGRITLQVLDTEYSMIREVVQDMVNELFQVAAEKNGFMETDPASGLDYLVFSALKFSRMALRDYADIFDFFWNLYQNGSLDKDTLLEFFNLDPVDVEAKLKSNFLTINDNLADEFRRAIYSEATSRIFEDTDITDRLIDGFGLDRKKPSSMEMPPEKTDEFMMDSDMDVPIPESALNEDLEAGNLEFNEDTTNVDEGSPEEQMAKELGEFDSTEPDLFSEPPSPELSGRVNLPAGPAGPSGPVIP